MSAQHSGFLSKIKIYRAIAIRHDNIVFTSIHNSLQSAYGRKIMGRSPGAAYLHKNIPRGRRLAAPTITGRELCQAVS